MVIPTPWPSSISFNRANVPSSIAFSTSNTFKDCSVALRVGVGNEGESMSMLSSVLPILSRMVGLLTGPESRSPQKYAAHPKEEPCDYVISDDRDDGNFERSQLSSLLIINELLYIRANMYMCAIVI